MRFIIIFIAVLSFSLPALADPPPPTQDSLSQAIFRFKTGESGNIRWRECNRFIRGAEALARAEEYAGYLMDEFARDPEFDPWRAAAIMAQESSFNRCAISRAQWRTIREGFVAHYHREPTERDIQSILRRSGLRRRLGARQFDAGLAQFRWPGVAARRAGLTDPAALIDARQNIHLTAVSFQHLRAYCDTHEGWSGVYTTRRGRTIRYRVSCEDAYWVRHNSPSRFNYRYYSSVNRRYRQLLEYATTSTEESDEHS